MKGYIHLDPNSVIHPHPDTLARTCEMRAVDSHVTCTIPSIGAGYRTPSDGLRFDVTSQFHLL